MTTQTSEEESDHQTHAGSEMLKLDAVATVSAQEAAAAPLERIARLARSAWLLPGFTLLSLLVRLACLRLDYVLTPDGVSYVLLARQLAAANFRAGISTYWPPLYPMLVGFMSWLCGDIELAGRLVSVLAGSLLVIPVYFLIRRADRPLPHTTLDLPAARRQVGRLQWAEAVWSLD